MFQESTTTVKVVSGQKRDKIMVFDCSFIIDAWYKVHAALQMFLYKLTRRRLLQTMCLLNKRMPTFTNYNPSTLFLKTRKRRSNT